MAADAEVDEQESLLPRSNPLLRNRKLVLVLDLDHTLVHTTGRRDLSPDESYLLNHPDLKRRNLNDTNSLFAIDPYTITKLRPFVRTFLHHASYLFDMYIYTLASRQYAHAAADILDPGRRRYFRSPSKLISREDGDCRHKKSLDLVPADERTVIIVDDRISVWKDHRDNLIHIEAYQFFAFGCPTDSSLSELRKDEVVQNGGGLAGVLDVLRRAHHAFFDDTDVAERDVRVVLREMRRRVLEGCRIAFSREVRQDCNVCSMAVQMGAECVVAAEATHAVVETKAKAKTARWAVKNGKLLVTVEWVHAAYYTWRRPKEEDYFPVVIGTPSSSTTQTENNFCCCCCTIM